MKQPGLALAFLLTVTPILAQPQPQTAVVSALADSTLAARPMRDGMVELKTADAAALLAETLPDARYAALQQTALDRGLRLEPLRAKAARLPEGDRTAFVPVLDADGKERGFLAHAGDSWTLAFEMPGQSGQVIETYRAKLDESGHPSIEAVSPKDASNAPNVENATSLEQFETQSGGRRATTESVITYPTRSCAYVKSYGLNWGCVNFGSNPFGYYYLMIARVGYGGPSYSWWACYQGAIHICPVQEYPGSPYYRVSCGFPPAHPVG
jgi:hypothetical protein